MDTKLITLDEDLDATSNGPIVIRVPTTPLGDANPAPEEEPEPAIRWRKTHRRAGITKNKGRGESKARRTIAKRSRRINRSR